MTNKLPEIDQDKVVEDKGLPELSKPVSEHIEKSKDDQLRLGEEVEKEHSETIKQIISDVRAGVRKPIREYFKDIAEDHLKEISDYYNRLCEMEEQAKVEKGELTNAIKGIALATALAQGTQFALQDKQSDQIKPQVEQVRDVAAEAQAQKQQWHNETQKEIDEIFARNDREAFLGSISDYYKRHPDTERTPVYGLHYSTIKDYIRNSPDHLKEYPYLLKYPGHILHDAVAANPELERDVAIWHHDGLKQSYNDQDKMAHAWLYGRRNTDMAVKNNKHSIRRTSGLIFR